MDCYEDLVSMLIEVQMKLSEYAEKISKLDPDDDSLVMIHYYGAKLTKALHALDIPKVTYDPIGVSFINRDAIARMNLPIFNPYIPRANDEDLPDDTGGAGLH